MTVAQILDGLEHSDTTGIDAERAARLCFLEWVVNVEGTTTPRAAREALSDPSVRNASSAAARAFVEFLEQATCPIHTGAARAARRQRHVH